MFKEWQRHHPKNVLGLLNVRIFNFSEILHRYTYNHIQEEWPFYPPWNKQPAPENSCLEAYFFLCGMAYSQGVFAVKLSGSVTGFVSSRWSWMFSLSQLRCLGFPTRANAVHRAVHMPVAVRVQQLVRWDGFPWLLHMNGEFKSVFSQKSFKTPGFGFGELS